MEALTHQICCTLSLSLIPKELPRGARSSWVRAILESPLASQVQCSSLPEVRGDYITMTLRCSARVKLKANEHGGTAWVNSVLSQAKAESWLEYTTWPSGEVKVKITPREDLPGGKVSFVSPNILPAQTSVRKNESLAKKVGRTLKNQGLGREVRQVREARKHRLRISQKFWNLLVEFYGADEITLVQTVLIERAKQIQIFKKILGV